MRARHARYRRIEPSTQRIAILLSVCTSRFDSSTFSRLITTVFAPAVDAEVEATAGALERLWTENKKILENNPTEKLSTALNASEQK